MSKISIGNDERDLSDADPQWITQEINGRRKDDLPVCIVIQINESGVDLTFVTPPSARGVGRQRQYSQRELAVIDLWEKLQLNSTPLDPGKVVAFVKRVVGLL